MLDSGLKEICILEISLTEEEMDWVCKYSPIDNFTMDTFLTIFFMEKGSIFGIRKNIILETSRWDKRHGED